MGTKLAVVCFGFSRPRLNRQPWKYIYEIMNYPESSEFTPHVISDTSDGVVENLEIHGVRQLYSPIGPADQLIREIEAVNPDVVVELLGMTSFLRPGSLASMVDPPVIGILGSHRYSLREVLNVGISELVRHPRPCFQHLAGTTVSNRRLRTKSDPYAAFVALTRENVSRFRDAGVSTPIHIVRSGIDETDTRIPPEEDIQAVRSRYAPAERPLITYFTSPTTLRGTEDLLKAFIKIRGNRDATLLYLSRQDNGQPSPDEKRLLDISARNAVQESFVLLSQNLSPSRIRTFLAASDIIALPYKLVLSCVPISVLEGMAMGRPVVTTNIGGLPELVSDPMQLIEPSNVDSLAETLGVLLDQPQVRDRVGRDNRERMDQYPRWVDSRRAFETVIREVLT